MLSLHVVSSITCQIILSNELVQQCNQVYCVRADINIFCHLQLGQVSRTRHLAFRTLNKSNNSCYASAKQIILQT